MKENNKNMKEPKKKYGSNDNLNTCEYCIESNINKMPSIIRELSKKNNCNTDDSNSFIYSISSNTIKTINTNSNLLNLNKTNNNEECKEMINEQKNSNLNKLIYHRKSINNFCTINRNEKGNKNNKLNYLNKEENKNIIYNNNKIFTDLTLSEYLKEEIKNMKYNNHNYDKDYIYKNIKNNNPEETKVNTIDINNYITNETPNSYRNMLNKKYNNFNMNINRKQKINNYLIRDTKKYITYNSYLNKYNKINDKEEEKKLSYKKYSSNKSYKVKNFNKSVCKLNKYNLIKKIEFISFNPNQKDINTSFRKRKQKKLNTNSNKILNISFNNNGVMNKKEKNLCLSNKNHNLICLKKNNMKKNKNDKYDKTFNKKIKIKKIDIFNKQINDIKKENYDKPLFCIKIDLEKLMNENENDINNDKGNKKYRFSKSTKKLCYKNININDLAKDFFIVPKQSNNNK